MKLILEITTLDDKREVHECIDFAEWGGDFVTLYKKNFVRERLRVASILRVKQYFKT